MEQRQKEELARSVKDFALPRYQEIPDVGLYLEQVAKFISQCLAPLESVSITGSMISNYVKKGLVPSPVKKQYDREQIASLLFIAVAKSVLSMEDIGLLLNIQRCSYPTEQAYDYFHSEFHNVLFYVFGLSDKLYELDSGTSDDKLMLRSTIITVAYKVYLDKCFALLHGEREANKKAD